ncbi:hypothetical protein [Okeania sp. SIO3B5]|nr:hypothetical protein [Okeania sp. SIO3B5]
MHISIKGIVSDFVITTLEEISKFATTIIIKQTRKLNNQHEAK